jgi:hypothetical protein
MKDPLGGRDLVMRIAVLAAVAMIVLALVMLIGLTMRRQFESPPMNGGASFTGANPIVRPVLHRRRYITSQSVWVRCCALISNLLQMNVSMCHSPLDG